MLSVLAKVSVTVKLLALWKETLAPSPFTRAVTPVIGVPAPRNCALMSAATAAAVVSPAPARVRLTVLVPSLTVNCSLGPAV